MSRYVNSNLFNDVCVTRTTRQIETMKAGKLRLKHSNHILTVLTTFLAPCRDQKSLRFRPLPSWKRRGEQGYGKAKTL